MVTSSSELPTMIEDIFQIGNSANTFGPYFRELFGAGHRRMRALGHKNVEFRDAAPCQNFRRDRKKLSGIIVAGLVRNNGQHT